MGYNIGIPCLKLNNVGTKSKHCGGFAQVASEALEERKGRDKDIDVEKADLNINYGFKTAAELLAYSDQHVRELSEKQRAAGKRGIRNDAVRMIATVIKPPAEYINKMDHDGQVRFLNDSYEVFKEIVGDERIKAATMHFDELSPHIHIFWEPMTDDGRLCCKEVLNLKMYQQINREMPKSLREKGYEIDDCKMYDQKEEERILAEKMENYIKEHEVLPEEVKEVEKKLKEERFQETHAKRGRSSAQFKGDIKKENIELLAEKTKIENDIARLNAERQQLTLTMNEEIEALKKEKIKEINRELEEYKENKIQEILSTVFEAAKKRIYEVLDIIPKVQLHKIAERRNELFNEVVSGFDRDDREKFQDKPILSADDRKYIEDKYLSKIGTFNSYSHPGKTEQRLYRLSTWDMTEEQKKIEDFLERDTTLESMTSKPHSISEVLESIGLTKDLEPVRERENEIYRGHSR